MSLTRRVFTERRKAILPLLVFLVVNAAVAGLVLYLERNVQAEEDARMEAVLALDSARKLEITAKAQRISKERADVELRRFYGEILPSDLRTSVNVTNFWLGRIAEGTRLTYRAGNYDHEQLRDSRLVKVTGAIKLVGEYADIRRFLYEVETAEEFVIIERVELSQPSAAQGNSQLELALSIATYYLANGQPGAVSR
jgi:hypothetical protein